MKKLFTTDFKQRCINLMLHEQHTVAETSKIMNVSISALQRWKVQYIKEKQGITPVKPAITAEQREIQRLRTEVEQLRSDNALLKKVSAFFLDKH
ncbi:transposase [Testudinibacter aquarius]|uniref:Transposase n=1 Tax=Testudinibacter aquarius TaxID=1524974 RepID=A0A4R3XUQ3_9PAST|nr:transposase [Testudinibacter aquarius]TNG89096.1 transposase [Pasteurellaceae bacterium USgator41]TNG93949.1 transposase [Pasteurellaceae bacterium UScroc12]TNG95486.1 transposase [Pasteurellaceae bacterium UScroc31]TNH02421.1 transposase [Pasteurellaceae bacterium USgator11]KAE9526398.1 transposase [Testudinibacter aquarius]